MECFSQAAENNKRPIADALTDILSAPGTVLEVGSGSGQHALFFAAVLPHIRWRPSERAEVLPALTLNLEGHAPDNVEPPVELDLARNDWPLAGVDAVFSANVLHIVRPGLGENLIRGGADRLAIGGKLICYGPFKYGGEFTTASNAGFDEWLRARDPQSGIRDIEWMIEVGREGGLELTEDRAMPANNQLLVFEKRAAL